MSDKTHPVRLALGGMLALAAAIGIGRFIYTPLLPPMVEALSLSKGQAGLIASANFAGYLLGAVLAAAPRLPFGQRTGLLLALATSGLTTALMALPSGMAEFLLLRLIGGAASAFVMVLASALVLERLAEAGHGRLSALHFAGVGTGISASAVLTWWQTAVGGDWRVMWIGGGVLSALGLVAAMWLIPDVAPRPASRPVSSADGAPSRLALSTAYLLFGFGYVITATFLVAIVRASPEARELEPVFWLILGIAAIPSVAVWTVVGRRIGVMPAYAVACLIEAAGVIASVASTGAVALAAAAAILGGTFMGITALGLIAGRSLPGGDPRQTLAILTAAFGCGQIVGPVVAGYGHDATGSFLLPSMVAAGALVLSALIAMALHAKLPR